MGTCHEAKRSESVTLAEQSNRLMTSSVFVP